MKQMIVDAKQLDFFNKWLQVSEIDFDKEDFLHDATLFCQTVEFDDGTFADLKVCSGQTNLWCEMVWYSENGCEIACSDACADRLDGEWKYPFEDGNYDVEVVRG